MKKLNDLEKHVCKLPKIDGSSRIMLTDEAESVVTEQAQWLAKTKRHNELMPNEWAIIETASHIAWIRAADIFDSCIVEFLCRGDKAKRILFYLEFRDFWDTMRKMFAEMDERNEKLVESKSSARTLNHVYDILDRLERKRRQDESIH